jgi:hypothetical protein
MTTIRRGPKNTKLVITQSLTWKLAEIRRQIYNVCLISYISVVKAFVMVIFNM